MPTNNGKIIVSLLAGATAGVVAGLLLAPETGDQTRAGLRRSTSKIGGDLSKLLRDTLSRFGLGAADQGGHTNQAAYVSEDRTAADALLNSLGNQPGDLSTPAGDGVSVGGNRTGESIAGSQAASEDPLRRAGL